MRLRLPTERVWWAKEGSLEPAAVLLGYLTENAVNPDGGLLGIEVETLAVIEADPRHPTWRRRGESMTRDEVVDYALHRFRSIS